MKEWQRWEAMAEDFAKVGDHRREAECLEMALEILPPGHGDDKVRLVKNAETARTRRTETGDRAILPNGDVELSDDLRVEMESMGLEDAREAVMAVVRRLCTTIDGASEVQIVDEVTSATSIEQVLVREVLEELVDEGILYHGRRGQVMLDGIIEESDLETAALGVLGQLSTEGRGGARDDVVQTLTGRGFARDEVEEVLDELVEAGRLDEDHRGQIRPALDPEAIEEIHHQVFAALEEMDTEGSGVLDARLERELTSRGMELAEVSQALDDLVDTGDVVRDGGEVRLAGPDGGETEARNVLIEVVHALSEDMGRPVATVTVLRAARSRGLASARAHRTLEGLLDSGQLWRDDRGVHLPGEGSADPARARKTILGAVRELADEHQMGAPRVEVIDLAVTKGLGEEEARETLEDLVDDGFVHDTGSGFLRPG
jgi:SOS response regulatory protein OraA/RecX